MNSIKDLREIYDELYQRGKAAAAARTTLPDDVREKPDAATAERLPAIAVRSAKPGRGRARYVPLAAVATVVAILALVSGVVVALHPWSVDRTAVAGAVASKTSPAASTPPAAVSSPGGTAMAPQPRTPDTPATPATVNPAEVSSSSARCYATSDVSRPDNYFSVTIGGDGSSPVAAGPLALQLCSNSWREGILSATPPFKIDNPNPDAKMQVPVLVACVLPPDNSDENIAEVAILPGSAGTCSEVGLAPFPANG